MWSTWTDGRRFACLGAIAVGVVALGLPPRAAAQAPAGDARWQRWLGCWTPAAAQSAFYTEPAAQQVCVVAAEGTSAVDIVTLSGQQILSRERVEASGVHRPSAHDGCSGWESAEWSSDGRRVYLQSESDCAGGVKRSTTGIMTFAGNGDWLHIVGVGMRDTTGVRTLRNHPSAPLSTLPPELASAVAARTSESEALRWASAQQSIGTPEIVDASRHVNAGVVQAWIAESHQTFTVNARRLRELADAGVDGRVTDMMIALSYPMAFSIDPSPTTVGALAAPEGGRGGGGGDLGGFGSMFGCGPYVTGLSVYGWDGCSFYGSSIYGPRYGYSRSDLLGYGGWYALDSPGIIVIRPVEPGSAPHGRVVNGNGYSAGGDSGSTASASSGGGSSASSSSSGGGGGASSGGDRTAVPR